MDKEYILVCGSLMFIFVIGLFVGGSVADKRCIEKICIEQNGAIYCKE